MDFFEAVKLMKDGERVKLKCWPDDQYLGLKEESFKIFGKNRKKYVVVNSDETELSPLVSFCALVSGEWELVED